MSTLKKGDKVPHFELYDQHENLFRLKEHLGQQKLVIYLYPKDDTPGCTTEACGFRDNFADFADHGCKVIGISSDDTERHKSFAEKYQLPFSLLSDPDEEVRKKFGVPRSMFGMFPGRVTYITDKHGIIQHVFNSQFYADKHVKEALQVIKFLKND